MKNHTPIKIQSVTDFQKKKELKQKISMLTCYDSWSAQLLDSSSIDALLIGDSVAMVNHGHKTTIPATLNMMALHCQAVARSAPHQFLVGDLPFMSYRRSRFNAVKAAETLMRTGVHSVKLEGAAGNIELVKHLVESGIPVMGHLGLTPQALFQLGGFKVQGKTAEAAKLIKEQAHRLEDAGCFSIVLECVPSSVATEITQSLNIPTIGIGAGAETDGQILVLHDLLGLNQSFKPKFVRTFLNGAALINEAIEKYANEVSAKTFPISDESY